MRRIIEKLTYQDIADIDIRHWDQEYRNQSTISAIYNSAQWGKIYSVMRALVLSAKVIETRYGLPAPFMLNTIVNSTNISKHVSPEMYTPCQIEIQLCVR